MRVVIQRVSSARVEVEGEVTGRIGHGLLVLAGFEAADDVADNGDLARVAGKIAQLRIFDDAAGVMNRSLDDVGGEVLAVSQFTLFASIRKGKRPSWSQAAAPAIARPLFARFVDELAVATGRPIATGIFGADMQVHLVGDGPVTISFDSRAP